MLTDRSAESIYVTVIILFIGLKVIWFNIDEDPIVEVISDENRCRKHLSKYELSLHIIKKLANRRVIYISKGFNKQTYNQSMIDQTIASTVVCTIL